MKLFSVKSLASLSLLAALIGFSSCEKDSLQTPGQAPVLTTTDRAPLMYGVTIYSPGKPSKLIEINVANGAVLNAPGVQLSVDFGGGAILIDDLKGVCLINGGVYATTGPNNTVDALNDALIRVADVVTGASTVVSYSTVGTVSDIDYDELTGTIYGLRNNSNNLISITGGGFNVYTAVGAITNLGGGFVSKGLSFVRDGGGDRLVVAANANSGLQSARICSVPLTAGAATFLANVTPASQTGSGNCGIGFQFGINSMVINRSNTVTVAGLNSFAWANPLPNPSASALWGGVGYHYEDLTSAFQ
jgi:hypothetical protein